MSSTSDFRVQRQQLQYQCLILQIINYVNIASVNFKLKKCVKPKVRVNSQSGSGSGKKELSGDYREMRPMSMNECEGQQSTEDLDARNSRNYVKYLRAYDTDEQALRVAHLVCNEHVRPNQDFDWLPFELLVATVSVHIYDQYYQCSDVLPQCHSTNDDIQ